MSDIRLDERTSDLHDNEENEEEEEEEDKQKQKKSKIKVKLKNHAKKVGKKATQQTAKHLKGKIMPQQTANNGSMMPQNVTSIASSVPGKTGIVAGSTAGTNAMWAGVGILVGGIVCTAILIPVTLLTIPTKNSSYPVNITFTTLTTTTVTTTTITTTTSTSTSTTTTTPCTAWLPNTTITINPLPSQCNSYIVITDYTRNIYNYSLPTCDNLLFNTTPTWVQFSGAAGTMMINCPKNLFFNLNTVTFTCGASARGWYSGIYPSIPGNTTTGIVCYAVNDQTSCQYNNTISVTDCNGFYIYALIAPPTCQLRYCTM